VQWSLGTLLHATVAAIAAGARSLAEVEKHTTSLSRAMRRKLGIPRRVPDTTLRDNLCAVEPHLLRPCLHALVRAAYRRKALAPDRLPFGALSLDGKGTALPTADDHHAQRQTSAEGPLLGGAHRQRDPDEQPGQALHRRDAHPAGTNEMGSFPSEIFGPTSLCGPFQAGGRCSSPGRPEGDRSRLNASPGPLGNGEPPR